MSANGSIHVSLHEFLDEVDLVKKFVRDGFLNINDGNDLIIELDMDVKSVKDGWGIRFHGRSVAAASFL